MALKLILVDPNQLLCESFNKYFSKYENVSIVNDRFENIPEFDCIVTAGNSFGLMDGGVDYAIVRYFGTDLQTRVQKYILGNFLGEQPVGTSFIIESGNKKHPFVAHTPTMRIPMTIEFTDYVYLAMKAALLAVYHHNNSNAEKINILACPGLGTATGKVDYDEAARQMELAYRFFIDPPKAISWGLAVDRQKSVIMGGEI